MAEELLDLAELKERLDGDKELFLEICCVFFEDFILHEKAMQTAIDNNSGNTLKEHAHTVKGAFANLSMKKAAHIAMQLETAGNDNSFQGTEKLLSDLSKEVEGLQGFKIKVESSDIWER